jgi:hypothetical protein
MKILFGTIKPRFEFPEKILIRDFFGFEELFGHFCPVPFVVVVQVELSLVKHLLVSLKIDSVS